MPAIAEVLTRVLMPAVPFAALALLAYGGYLVSKHRSAKLADSPWLWLGAFSLVGLLGLWAISPKYDDRQKRLEARYEARQRIAESQSGDGRGDSGKDGQAGYSNERRVPLEYLAVGLLLIAAGSLAMVNRSLTQSKD